MISNRFFLFFLALLLVLSIFPNLAYAADSVGTIEKLVKNAETQSSTLVKQMSSSNLKDIKEIGSKSTTNLTSTINKAKASLKNFKGKQKPAFEKRIKVTEQTLVKVKTYNPTKWNEIGQSAHYFYKDI